MKKGCRLIKCPSCKGKGTKIKYSFMLMETITTCSRCFGSGKIEVIDHK